MGVDLEGRYRLTLEHPMSRCRLLASSDLAACYQLAQSVLKIGYALTDRGGGWVHRSA